TRNGTCARSLALCAWTSLPPRRARSQPLEPGCGPGHQSHTGKKRIHAARWRIVGSCFLQLERRRNIRTVASEEEWRFQFGTEAAGSAQLRQQRGLYASSSTRPASPRCCVRYSKPGTSASRGSYKPSRAKYSTATMWFRRSFRRDRRTRQVGFAGREEPPATGVEYRCGPGNTI